MPYGNVYVAQVAIGRQRHPDGRRRSSRPRPGQARRSSSPTRTCIAHGIDMADVDDAPEGRRAAAATGRSTASTRATASTAPVPARLASTPTIPSRLRDERGAVRRCSQRSDPERADAAAGLAQADVDERWRYYEQLPASSAPSPATCHLCRHAIAERRGGVMTDADLTTTYLGLRAALARSWRRPAR